MSKDGSQGVYNLFNTESKLVTFVPEKVYYNYTDPSYNDIRLNEFYMLDAENNILYPKGHYPERTEVRFKTIFDFKFAYAHEVWPKPDGSRILVNYVRTRRFRIYDLSARLLHDVCLDYALINMLWMQILNVGQRLLEIVLLLINTFICYVRRVSNPVWL